MTSKQEWKATAKRWRKEARRMGEVIKSQLRELDSLKAKPEDNHFTMSEAAMVSFTHPPLAFTQQECHVADPSSWAMFNQRYCRLDKGHTGEHRGRALDDITAYTWPNEDDHGPRSEASRKARGDHLPADGDIWHFTGCGDQLWFLNASHECVRLPDHEGEHQDVDGATWSQDHQTASAEMNDPVYGPRIKDVDLEPPCRNAINVPEGNYVYKVYVCTEDKGHDGEHRDKDGNRWKYDPVVFAPSAKNMKITASIVPPGSLGSLPNWDPSHMQVVKDVPAHVDHEPLHPKARIPYVLLLDADPNLFCKHREEGSPNSCTEKMGHDGPHSCIRVWTDLDWQDPPSYEQAPPVAGGTFPPIDEPKDPEPDHDDGEEPDNNDPVITPKEDKPESVVDQRTQEMQDFPQWVDRGLDAFITNEQATRQPDRSDWKHDQQYWIDTLIDMWKGSPKTREAVRDRFPGLGWTFDHAAGIDERPCGTLCPASPSMACDLPDGHTGQHMSKRMRQDTQSPVIRYWPYASCPAIYNGVRCDATGDHEIHTAGSVKFSEFMNGK